MAADFWDKRAKRYDDEIRKHNSIYRKTMDRTKLLLTDSDVVLDFGCATGEMSLDIAPIVQRVHGVDRSRKMIELANQKASDRQIDNVDFSQGDVVGQGLESHSFSAIIASDIIHLLDNAPEAIVRLNDLLPKGGLLISQTPCLGERNWLFRAFIKVAQKLGLAPPISSLTVVELESLVSDSGFEITESKLWDEKYRTQWIVARKL